MRLPTLAGELLEVDTALSNVLLRPVKQQLHLKVGMRRNLPYKITVEAAGRVVQNVDHFVLDDADRDGFWLPVSLGRFRRLALDLRLRQALDRGFSQELMVVVQRLSTQDSIVSALPLEPEWTADWSLVFKNSGPLGVSLNLKARGPMVLRLAADPWASELDYRGISLDLGLKASYRLTAWLSILVRADNLFAVFAFVNQPGAAMAADVVKSADNAFCRHHQRDRLPRNLHRLHVTGVDELVAKTGEHPVVTKNCLLLQLEKVGAGVGKVGQPGAFGHRFVEPSILNLLQKIGLYLSLGCVESEH